jgi:hypothetical protein
MAPDEMKNLGFADLEESKLAPPKKEPEKGVKGELQW